MQAETKNCRNCHTDFLIQPDDFAFYGKLGVPAPSWCPECRCMRRMVHRNERSLHKRTCDMTGKSIISIYRPDCPYTICDKDYYFSDAFDPLAYSAEYVQSAPFFPQFYEFAKRVPLPSLFLRNSINCLYNQDMGGSKDCYLCFRTHDSQNMLYTYRGNHSSYCTDCFQTVDASEFLYECVNVITCSHSRFLHSCEKCSGSAFLFNCSGCVDCFMCTDLRNKQCCYRNVQYSRPEYEKMIASYDLSSHLGQEKALKEFEEFLKMHPRKNLIIIRSNNVLGDGVFDSKDSKYVWNVRNLENCSYVWDSFDFKDCMDTYSGARAELIYEATATTKGSNNCHFCVRVHSGSVNCEYSWFLQNCSNCFGCVGLSNKEYCVFNKEYSKEEYSELVERIKTRMKEDGEYGEFFPMYTSPFPYNDTVAQEFFPLDQRSAEERGLLWEDSVDKNYNATISGESVPDSLKDVSDSILKEVILCEDGGGCTHGCTKAFRIVEDELAFYRRLGIPIPRKCPNCRYYRRLSYRNPTKLRRLDCMCSGNGSSSGIYKNTASHEHGSEPCRKKIDTTIPEDQGMIVYCDSCYKREVY